MVVSPSDQDSSAPTCVLTSLNPGPAYFALGLSFPALDPWGLEPLGSEVKQGGCIASLHLSLDKSFWTTGPIPILLVLH